MSTVINHPASFLDHRGKFNTENGHINFYGITFSDILEAMAVLKMVKKDEVGHAFASKYGAGITTIYGSVIAGSQHTPFRWFPSEKTAKEYLRDIHTYKGFSC